MKKVANVLVFFVLSFIVSSCSNSYETITKEELLKQSNSTKGRKESKEAIEKRSIIRSYNWKIIDPNGIEYYSSRLKIFCEQYKLKYTSAIYSAKRNIPSIKGPNKGWVFILFEKK